MLSNCQVGLVSDRRRHEAVYVLPSTLLSYYENELNMLVWSLSVVVNTFPNHINHTIITSSQ